MFKKNFIRGLKVPQKLLWVYLFCDCDNAGVWEIDTEIASIYTGTQIKFNDLKIFYGDRIILFDNNKKIFIPEFITFQYTALNENNPAHKNVICELLKYQLINPETKEPLKPVGSTFEGTKDMDKDKEEVKEKEMVKEKTWHDNFKNFHEKIIYPFELPEFGEAWDLWIAYRTEKKIKSYKPIGEQAALKDVSDLSNHNLQTAIDIIHQSIKKGWQGLFELKTTGNNGKEPYSVAKSAATINRIIDESFQGS